MKVSRPKQLITRYGYSSKYLLPLFPVGRRKPPPYVILLAVMLLFHSFYSYQHFARPQPRPPLLSPTLPDTLPRRLPTHSACTGYNGVLHIQHGDAFGGFGANMYQFVIGQLLYAEANNLIPWIHLSPESNALLYDVDVHFREPTERIFTKPFPLPLHNDRPFPTSVEPGPLSPASSINDRPPPSPIALPSTGIWEHYFEPVYYVPGDRSCQRLPVYSMTPEQVIPGLHRHAPWAPRTWRYRKLPHYIAQPHVPYNEWIEIQRKRAYPIVKKYYRPREYISEWVNRVNPGCSWDKPCLGLHIRHTDKTDGRVKIQVADFLEYAEAFVESGGQHIYLATDSSLVQKEIRSWPFGVQSKIRTIGDNIVRSSSQEAVFKVGKHHQVNQEILVEILALSSCQYLVHGHSAVTEAAMYTNLDLHNSSVNLEDPDHLSVWAFGRLVALSTEGSPRSNWPKPRSTDRWWDQAPQLNEELTPSNTACNGYDGVLRIRHIAEHTDTVSPFFESILSQLHYADEHNLMPWIRLSRFSSVLIYDNEVHQGDTVGASLLSFTMVPGSVFENDDGSPGPPVAPTTTKFRLYSGQGSGIWDTYFEPVSDFVPGDSSCQTKPLYELTKSQVTHLRNRLSAETSPADQEDIVDSYFRFRPYILRHAESIFPKSETASSCLAVDLRLNNEYEEYMDYIAAYEKAGGSVFFIRADNDLTMNLLLRVAPNLEFDGRLIHTQGQLVARSTLEHWPTHMMDTHHRVNSEALLDIFAMSRCPLFLHSGGVVADAVQYLNPDATVVNVADDNRWTARQFETTVHRSIGSSAQESPDRTPRLAEALKQEWTKFARIEYWGRLVYRLTGYWWLRPELEYGASPMRW